MKHIALALAVGAALLAGCKEEKKPEAAKTEAPAPVTTSEAPKAEPPIPAAVALVGTYKGILPCASCEGIDTTLVLKDGMTYELTTLFLGEPDAKPQTVSGSFILGENGTLVKLDVAGDNNVYLASGDTLEMRNADGSDGGRTEEQRAAYRLQKQ
ncbi:MAG: copper resistance protein NlpE [Cardiobacteriaceae bacterium]|nr:copper resistance protein NlpE [Cardiobacteriaceae bacterium]